jgi:lipopolysaccharide biosynthesis glycosyltransferase
MKFFIAYNKLYQDAAKTTFNAVWTHHPEAEIHAVCSSDVDHEVKGVHYYYHDPKIDCKIIDNATNKGYNNIVYNFIYAIDILKIDKAILLGVDCLVLGDVSELYNSPTGESGFACIPMLNASASKTWAGMMKHWSNGYKVEDDKKDLQAFNTGSMVFDFDKLRKNNAFEKLEKLIKDYNMSEMAAFCIYADDKWVRLDNKYGVRSDFNTDLKDVKILDYAGKHKPWKKQGKNVAIWEKYTGE